MNLHGGKQEYGVNYWETYAATLAWPPIQFLLTLALIKSWHTRQIDFTLAYPQADVECDLYMDIPKGFEVGKNSNQYCLQILKNIYGQKQAGRMWALHLKKGLLSIGFVQSGADDCIFFRGSTIFMVYVDDGIFMGPSKGEIDICIKDMELIFKLTDEGNISDYLGIKVTKLPDGRISLTQPHLIDIIIADLNFADNTKAKEIPAISSHILQRDLDGDPFEEHWDFRSIIGKLNFLEKSTRPDIAYAVHQCARFSSAPCKSHAIAIRQIARYLLGTKDKGIILEPKGNEFTVWCDADFCGNWNKETAISDPVTAKSRSGYAITYASCPIFWASKMQTEVTLSTTESEYVSLSQSLQDVIPLMRIVDEIREQFDKDITAKPTVRCTVFEDNSGALELANVPKMRPRTKHINNKYHHFRDHVRNKQILVKAVDTREQVADYLTKPLPRELFQKHRMALQNW